MEATIKDVINDIRDCKEDGHCCALLIGAGCSVSAGIPLANEIVEHIKNKYSDWYDKAETKDYSTCMSKLKPQKRFMLIKNYVKNAKMNWASIGIAQLIHEDIVDRVLTTNFDPLIIRACSLIGEYPAVYDLATTSIFVPANIDEKSIFYLHGQHTGFIQIHSEKDDYPESIASAFQATGTSRLWIVVGYSGENDPVFKRLTEFPRFDNRLYWICYKDNEPAPHVREKLLTPGKEAFYVKGYDADDFFTKLCQELKCFPPSFISAPFTSLKNAVDDILPYSPPGEDQKIDIMLRLKEQIDKAISTFEQSSVGIQEIESAFVAGDYEKVLRIESEYKGEKSESLKDMIAWSYIMLGNELYDHAKTKSGDEADRLFLAAIEKYNAAFDSKPSFHVALNNWGAALDALAKTKSGDEAEKLFLAAIDKYDATVKIKSDYHQALYNWGLALYDLAKIKSGNEADRLFHAAIEKYEAAVKIKPDLHEALNNWGIALSALAQTKSGNEADRLFTEAESKFKEVSAIVSGYGSYDLACISSIRGDEESCKRWLEDSKSHNKLPSKEHILKDADLDNMRDKQWFKDFLDSLE